MPAYHLLEAAVDSLPDGMVILRADGTVHYMNRTARRTLGYDAKSDGEINWFDHVIPEGEREKARRRFQRHLDRESGENASAISRRPTSEEAHKTVTWLRTIHDDGTRFVVGRLPPGTECAEPVCEDELIDPYQTLVDSFPNGIVTLFDREFRYQLVGGSIFDTLDLTPEALRGHTLREVFPPKNVEILEPLYQSALEGEHNTTTLTLQGRTFRIQVLPVYNEEGDVAFGMTVSQDVTKQKERERELRDARKRYRSLVEHAPVPIIVGDESGEIVELNEAAESLLGRNRTAVENDHYLTIFDREYEESCLEFVNEHIDYFSGSTRRYLPDGRQIHIVTAGGKEIPVELSVSTIDQSDGRLVHGILSDISAQMWYEEALEELHEYSETLLTAETEIEMAQSIVDAATDILELQLVSVNVYEPEEGTLTPIAYSDDVVSAIGKPPNLPINESIAGKVYLSNEAVRTDNVTSHEEVYNPQTNIRSQLIVPIEGYGVILCGYTTPSGFSNRTQRLLELLAQNAEAVFERTERERTLKGHEQKLERKTRMLQRVESLNEQLRQLSQIAVQADSRIELEQKTCDLFESHEPFTFLWCGDFSPEGNELQPQTWAGDERGYLETDHFRLDGPVHEPAIRTARSKNATVISNIARDVNRSPWRQEALRRGFQSAISVPVAYQDVLYGVLSIYSNERDSFTGRIRSALVDWGELMGYAINQIEKTGAILSTEGNVLRFELASRSCPLLRIAQERQCTIQFGGLRQQEGQHSKVYVRVLDQSPQQFIAAARDSTGITAVTRVPKSGEDTLFQIEFSTPFIATVLARYGIRLQRITGRGDGVSNISVTTPRTIPVHRVVEILSLEYPEVTLLETGKVDEFTGPVTPYADQILKQLTDRQRDVIELAYHGGYFESPKRVTGDEIADQMEISSSSVHNHLRAAERSILKAIISSTGEIESA